MDDELFDEGEEVTKEEGTRVYLALQRLAGISVTSRQAGKAWDALTQWERREMLKTYIQYLDEEEG